MQNMYRRPYGPDPNHFGHLRIPEGADKYPLAVVIHGGFWRDRFDLSHMEPVCETLQTQGLATWSLEYRRLGQTGGGWPGTVDDVIAAANYRTQLAAEFPIDLERCVAIGYSAGGHLALCVASTDRTLRGVVSLAGVADLQLAWDLRLSNYVVNDFLGGSPEGAPTASPMNRPIAIPQRLIHGELDESVPIEVARSYARHKREAGEDVELIELAGTTHQDLVNPESSAWPVVRKTIAALL